MTRCSVAHSWAKTTADNVRECWVCNAVEIRTPGGQWVVPFGKIKRPKRTSVEVTSLWDVAQESEKINE